MTVQNNNMEVCGSFSLLVKLAQSDIGDVFLGRCQGAGGFEKLAIVKRIHDDLMKEREIIERFYLDASSAACLDHPNIRKIYEIGTHEGQHYVALEYLEGIPFLDVLTANKLEPLLADRRLLIQLVSQACLGLHAAHCHKYGEMAGRVHADISPRSLFITATGTTKILDLDIAGIRGALVGRHGFIRTTSAYMSPEEIELDVCGPRGDQYAMAVIAWEAVTGKRLFKRDTRRATYMAIRDASVPRAKSMSPDIPPELDAAIMRGLEHDPSRRFDSIKDFGEALEQALMPEGPPQTPLTISATISEVFSRELKKQRDLVRLAKTGSLSETQDESNRAQSEGLVSELSPTLKDIEEWGFLLGEETVVRAPVFTADAITKRNPRARTDSTGQINRVVTKVGKRRPPKTKLRIWEHVAEIRTGTLVQTVDVEGLVARDTQQKRTLKRTTTTLLSAAVLFVSIVVLLLSGLD